MIPGLGQIYNGAFVRGIIWLIVTPGFWFGSGGTLGWICHVVSAYTAYRYAEDLNEGRRSTISTHGSAARSLRARSAGTAAASAREGAARAPVRDACASASREVEGILPVLEAYCPLLPVLP